MMLKYALCGKTPNHSKGGYKMFYVYLDSQHGTKLIGQSMDLATAEKIKKDKEADCKPGDLWNIRITSRPEKEFSFYD